MSIELAAALYVLFLAVAYAWSVGNAEVKKKFGPVNSASNADGAVSTTTEKKQGTA